MTDPQDTDRPRPKYRTVLYGPNPFTEERFALGALIFRSNEDIRFVENQDRACARCLGGGPLVGLVNIVVGDFLAAQAREQPLDWDQPPRSAGPLISLGNVRLMPLGVEDPEAWIRLLFRPNRDR